MSWAQSGRLSLRSGLISTPLLWELKYHISHAVCKAPDVGLLEMHSTNYAMQILWQTRGQGVVTEGEG